MTQNKVYSIIFIMLVITFLALELFPLQIGSMDSFITQLAVGVVMTSVGSVCSILWTITFFPRIPNILMGPMFVTTFFGLIFFTLYMALPVVA